ncbi:hypothetical protein [Elizabethkingia occulta]|uniref:hypothetical protein n=1 Tax=Elizabethkingia occulta TaxID=1867263 RepID=UPI00099984F5|nr:hypothetical protein [Elizabethkingia occulta]OPB98017.1 hypothetical protein BB020_14440 [Elizabethkingia occulta]
MRKLTLIFIFISALGLKAQKIPTYSELNICGQEGMANNFGFKVMGEQKYLSSLKDFEKEFMKINNGYPDYYRLYIIIGNVKSFKLYISLIPKSLVSEEGKKSKDFRVYGDKRTLEVSYDLKTKKISKPKPSMILYDI